MRCGKHPATRRTTRQFIWLPRWCKILFLFGVVGLVGAYLLVARQTHTVYTCQDCDRRDDGRRGGLAALALLIAVHLAALAAFVTGAPMTIQCALALAVVVAGVRAAAAPPDVHVRRMRGGHVILSLEPESRMWLPDGVAESFPVFFPHLTDRTVPLTLCHGCGHTNEALHGVCSRCQRVLDVRATVWRSAA